MVVGAVALIHFWDPKAKVEGETYNRLKALVTLRRATAALVVRLRAGQRPAMDSRKKTAVVVAVAWVAFRSMEG